MSAAFVLQGDCLERLREFPDNSIDSVVTDPPYGLSQQPDMVEVLRHWMADELREYTSNALVRSVGFSAHAAAAHALKLFPDESYTHRGSGFMGKTWDSFVPSPSVWREVLRVLKPGGHAVVFSGTRTYDLTVLAIRIAGFGIRDQLEWLYGSGFPKGRDLAKELDRIDRVGPMRARALRFTAWMRSTSITAARIDELTGSQMGNHYLTDKTQPTVPTEDAFALLRPHLPIPPEEIEALVRSRTIESENEKRRPVIGMHEKPSPGGAMRAGIGGEDVPLDPGVETVAYSAAARLWEGWNTALKPGHEPIVLAQKPRTGTIAANVLEHGTGGLNIDGCRVQDGRWPPNVLLDEDAAALVGGASRFFYCAKTSTAEREAGLDHLPSQSAGELTGGRAEGSAGLANPRAGAGRTSKGRRNTHPTVKPIALMRWLCRLVTPPGGTVLDPFTGSGSTGAAAVQEQLNFVGCELSEEYVAIAEARIAHWQGQEQAA